MLTIILVTLAHALVSAGVAWCAVRATLAWVAERDSSKTVVNMPRPKQFAQPKSESAPPVERLPVFRDPAEVVIDLPAPVAKRAKDSAKRAIQLLRYGRGSAAAAPAVKDVVNARATTQYREAHRLSESRLNDDQKVILEAIDTEVHLYDVRRGEPLLLMWEGKEWPCVAATTVRQDGEGRPFVNVAGLKPNQVVPVRLKHLRRPQG